MPASFTNYFKKESKTNAVPDTDPSPVSANTSPSSLGPESSSTSPILDSQSTATTADNVAPSLHKIKGYQEYRNEVNDNNEAGKGPVQEYEGGQQFFKKVVNNNKALSENSGATVASIAGSPPAGPTQKIKGTQVYHDEFISNNTLANGTAQVIEGNQVFWGRVENNNSRTIKSNAVNANNVNSTTTGNIRPYLRSYRSVRSHAIEGSYSFRSSNPFIELTNIPANIVNQHGTPNNQTPYLTNSSRKGANLLPANSNISNALMAPKRYN